MIRYINFLPILLIITTNIMAQQNIDDVLEESMQNIISVDKSSDKELLEGRIESLESRIYELEKKIAEMVLASQNEIKVEIPKENNKMVDAKSAAAINLEKRNYDNALSYFKDGDFERSANLFEEFIEEFPKSSLISNAYFWQGESYFKRDLFEKASIYYYTGYKKMPKGSKASDSLLQLAFALSKDNKLKESCATLEKLNKEFPKKTLTSEKRAKELYQKLSCTQVKLK